MDLTNPATAVVPTLDGEVLTVLAGVHEAISAREVHRRTRRGSRSGVQKVLDRLVEQGLVQGADAPPSRLYRLNRDHVAAEAVLILVRLRRELIDRIRRRIEQWDPAPLSAALFGSAARGDGGTSSDVDLLLVRRSEVTDDEPRWAEQVDRLAQDVRLWSGNPASMVQASLEDVEALVGREAPIAASLDADAVDLAGVPVRELLARGRSA